METVEEQRALALVRSVTDELELPLFEWDITNGLRRSVAPHPAAAAATTTPPPKIPRSWIAAATGASDGLGPMQPEDYPQVENPTIVNTLQPTGVLAHIETMTHDAVFVLKDFHRQMDDPVVV